MDNNSWLEKVWEYEENEKFDVPELDSNIHESFVKTFNEMLKYSEIKYKVVFCDNGEKMKLIKI